MREGVDVLAAGYGVDGDVVLVGGEPDPAVYVWQCDVGPLDQGCTFSSLFTMLTSVVV